MNTDHQRSQKFWTFVKCEQHSTKTHNLNSGSIIITWSDIGSSIYLSATSVTCDILCFKTTHLISTINRYYTWFTTRYSLSQNFKCNYHVWEAFRISCHQLNTFNPNFPSHFIQMDFYLQIIMGQQSVQWIGYMLEDLVFKFLARARELSLLQNIQINTSTHSASNSSFFSSSKLTRA